MVQGRYLGDELCGQSRNGGSGLLRCKEGSEVLVGQGWEEQTWWWQVLGSGLAQPGAGLRGWPRCCMEAVKAQQRQRRDVTAAKDIQGVKTGSYLIWRMGLELRKMGGGEFIPGQLRLGDFSRGLVVASYRGRAGEREPGHQGWSG